MQTKAEAYSVTFWSLTIEVICTLPKMNQPRSRRTSTITNDEIATLQREFIGLDKDGNGEISVEEIEALLRAMRVKLRISESDIRKALKIIDKDGDGTVDMKELNGVLEHYDTDGIIYKALSQRSEIRKDFERYDTDKSGFITKDELVQVVRDRTGFDMDERHAELMILDCDENNDNQIDYEEFCKLMWKSFMQKRILTKSSKLTTIQDSPSK